MLPLPALDTADGTARAALFEGYNDDVIETPSTATTPGQRRGSPFTGIDLTLKGDLSAPHSTTSLLLEGRLLHYTPKDQPVGADSRSGLAILSGAWMTDPLTTLSMSQSMQWADQDAVRLSESPLAALDAALGRKIFVVSTTSLQVAHDLAARDRMLVGASFGVRDVTRDESPISPYVGVDYMEPSLEPAYAHEFTERDVGELRLSLKYFYLPQALLDLTGRRGNRSTAQVSPNALWMHMIDEAWQGIALAGISISNTASDGGSTLYVTPTLGGQVRYMRDRVTAELGYMLDFMPITASYAPGLANVFTADFSGQPFRTGPAKNIALLARFSGGVSYIPASEDSTVIALDGALGVTAFYAFTSWMGVFAGYEGRLSRASETNSTVPPTQFARNMAFAGLSVTLSTRKEELGIELPTRPALTTLGR